jgi:arylsulfatase A-like enzyme
MSQTIQAELSEAGYRTALVGKFFNEWFTAPPYFDQWAMQVRPAVKTYYDARFNVGGDLLDVPDHSTNYTEEQAIGFLNGFEADDSRPWFMQISPYAPHPPATPEPEHAFAPVPAWERNPAVKEDLRDKPSWVQDVWSNRRGARSLRLNQLRSLMGVDDMVGNVFDTLNELGERDTLAIFMSDNGFMWLEHGLTGKRAAYNESVRIPFFVRWPEHIMGGTKSTKIIGNIDVAPTVYEATGIQPAYQLDGRSIWEPRRSEILLEHLDPASQQVPLWRSIWRPDRQYIESGSNYEIREYYGPTDPWQTRNLFGNATVGDEPADAEALAARVADYAECAGETCP